MVLIVGVACEVDLNMVPEAISKMLEPMIVHTYTFAPPYNLESLSLPPLAALSVCSPVILSSLSATRSLAALKRL